MNETTTLPVPEIPLRAALHDWLDQRSVRRAARNSGIHSGRLDEVRSSIDTLPPDTLRAIIHSLLTKPAVLAEVAKRVAARGQGTAPQAAEMLRRMVDEWREAEEGKAMHAAVVAELRLKAAN